MESSTPRTAFPLDGEAATLVFDGTEPQSAVAALRHDGDLENAECLRGVKFDADDGRPKWVRSE